MNKQMIACCGLDCERCDARVATVTDDAALRERTAALWTALNGVTITPEMIRCTGCRMEGGEDALLRRALRDPQMSPQKGAGDMRRLRGAARLRNASLHHGKHARGAGESEGAAGMMKGGKRASFPMIAEEVCAGGANGDG